MKYSMTLILMTGLSIPAIAAEAYQQPKLNSSISQALSSLSNSCQKFTADTEVDHSFELYDHHQSFALSHQWPDGSHTAFIGHSETGSDDDGQIMAFTMSDSMYNANQDIVSSNQTMPLQEKIYISEQHPSGMKWLPAPADANGDSDHGYLVVASQYEDSVRFREFDSNGNQGLVGVLNQSYIAEITDVWLNQHNGDYWLILHDMDNAEGAAYKASVESLFQYGTANEGYLDVSAFQYVNSYNSPTNTGCDKSLGQNAILVQDSLEDWYVVHTYTDSTCGANIGDNQVKAYSASFNSDGTFSLTTSGSPAASTTVGSSSSVTSEGADGAAGFRVTNDGRLVVYLGGQYSSLNWFDYISYIEECRAADL